MLWAQFSLLCFYLSGKNKFQLDNWQIDQLWTPCRDRLEGVGPLHYTTSSRTQPLMSVTQMVKQRPQWVSPNTLRLNQSHLHQLIYHSVCLCMWIHVFCTNVRTTFACPRLLVFTAFISSSVFCLCVLSWLSVLIKNVLPWWPLPEINHKFCWDDHYLL